MEADGSKDEERPLRRWTLLTDGTMKSYLIVPRGQRRAKASEGGPQGRGRSDRRVAQGRESLACEGSRGSGSVSGEGRLGKGDGQTAGRWQGGAVRAAFEHGIVSLGGVSS